MSVKFISIQKINPLTDSTILIIQSMNLHTDRTRNSINTSPTQTRPSVRF